MTSFKKMELAIKMLKKEQFVSLTFVCDEQGSCGGKYDEGGKGSGGASGGGSSGGSGSGGGSGGGSSNDGDSGEKSGNCVIIGDFAECDAIF